MCHEYLTQEGLEFTQAQKPQNWDGIITANMKPGRFQIECSHVMLLARGQVSLHLDCHFSGRWIADVEVDLCTEGGIEGVLDDRSHCLLSTTLHNTVWVSPWDNWKLKSLQKIRNIEPFAWSQSTKILISFPVCCAF